jgi:ABC-2 type transport system permease protein
MGAQKYLEIFRVQLKNNFVREAVYRTNFLTTVTVDLVWIGVQFSLFSVIYANVESLAGWTRDQTFFFLGIFFASDAIFSTLFQRNFWTFSDLVNKGELDILLTKPVHPLFLALTRFISMTAWFNVVLGLGIAWRYAGPAGFAGGWHWLELAPWLLVGNLTAVLLRFAFSVWIFWTERSWAISRLYFSFFTLADKPDSIFPWIVRRALLSVLPFAFIGSVPARALIHGLTPAEYAWVGLVILAFFWLDAVLWRKGLQRYQSASS